MKVLCCPDSFKESISAADAAAAMARGVRAAGGQADLCPLADGGEGTVDALLTATGGTPRTTHVTGPLGDPVEAQWGVLGDGTTAAIEMAAAAGLALVPKDRRDPTRTTTFGVGELIRAALDAGMPRIILGVGGSATCDGGCGAAQALGARFAGVDAPVTGGTLQKITAFDLSGLDPRLRDVELIVAADVTNPLFGPDGAAHVYAPQKGATPTQVRQLDAGLRHLASLFNQPQLPGAGAGAAGGLGFGAGMMLGATIRPGADIVLDAVGFDQRVAACDLVLTGEGRLDRQTISGKTIAAVLRRAAGVPVVALVGASQLQPDESPCPFRIIGEGLPPDESMRRTAELLQAAAQKEVTRRIV